MATKCNLHENEEGIVINFAIARDIRVVSQKYFSPAFLYFCGKSSSNNCYLCGGIKHYRTIMS